MPESRPALRRELRLSHLVFFNISSVAGVRWLASAAHAGPGSLALWLLAALAFLLPSALVVASLSRRFPEEGGFYVWTKRAFGDWHGFICAWLYFISNILFLPTLLLSGVTMASYMLGPRGIRYSEDPAFAIPVTLAVLWFAFLVNLVGLRVGKWPSILGGGSTYLIVVLLGVFGLLVTWRFGSATRFHLIPQASWSSLNFWSQIALAMTGLELTTVLGGEIQDPAKTIPRAAWISGFSCAAFYIGGTAALLALLPPDRISVLTGLAQAGDTAGARFGANWLSPGFALLITVGFIGQLSTYIAANTRLPFALGVDRYLPPAFAKLHPRWRTPHISIFSQAGLATLLLLLTQLGESLRAGYQILVDMVVIATLIPFIYIFGSGFKFGQRWAGIAGGLIAAAGVLLSMSPPPEVSSVWLFELKVVGGTILLALAGRATFLRSKAVRG
ncbi:MAG: APC family permease [Acidobacteriia bacterium]|nr:APC family permease [Terriglobia bacterium]